MTALGTLLYTAFHGKLIGEDAYGNRYFEAISDKTADGHKKRWVIYKGLAEPSKVTPDWHGWLHYTTETPPTEKPPVHYPWMKEPVPNLTGTTLAYVPSGHVNRGGRRQPTVADYDAWKP